MPQAKNQYLVSISIIGVLYFIFGFVTWLNGTLIPFLKLACDLHSDAQALLVPFAFYLAYFFLALPSAAILRAVGFKRGMSLGLAIMAVGALVFVPAASARNFGIFLLGLFIQGTGLALLQTAANPYISVIGPIESAAQRIAIMGICNKVAGALGPVIVGAIILKGATAVETQIAAAPDAAVRAQLLQDLSHRVISPYVTMAVVLLLLAAMIWSSPLPEIEEARDEGGVHAAATRHSIWQFPHLLLGVLCIFVYVAVEVMAGDVIGTYGKALGMKLDVTKNFTSYTLWSMVAGYVIGVITIPRWIKQEMALRVSAIVAMLFVAGAFVSSGPTSIMFIALLGLANSLMWPAIFPLAIDGLGRFTKTGSALLIMGIVGGALIPQVYARLAASMGPQSAFFWCTLPCYLYILYYAVWGHRAGRQVTAAAEARAGRTSGAAV